MPSPGTGCDVVLQSQEENACRGFVGLSPPRPVRILVRKGVPEASGKSELLVEALDQALGDLGGAAKRPRCRGSLKSRCFASREPQTLNLLVWSGWESGPDPEEEKVVSDWLENQPNAVAVAVIAAGADPTTAVPPSLRQFQVIRWESATNAALEAIAAAGLDAAERRVFLSYSHADGFDLAHAVGRLLAEARFSVFLDSFALAPGADFEERIQHELKEKAFLVLIETPAALESEWVVRREIGLAQRHRLGLASVRPTDSTSDRMSGFNGRRWDLDRSCLQRDSGGGWALTGSEAPKLRDFLLERHAESTNRRRWILEAGLRAALRYRGVPRGRVRGVPGGVRVDTAGRSLHVALRPRPADLLDMHAASQQGAGLDRTVMVSATPGGIPERQALSWLAGQSRIPRWDENQLLRLAARIAGGKA